jgi:hypothetical protein
MMDVPAVLTCALAHGRLQLTLLRGERDRSFLETCGGALAASAIADNKDSITTSFAAVVRVLKRDDALCYNRKCCIWRMK